jgi:uncharacterized protein YqjF (DUF2071 family)
MSGSTLDSSPPIDRIGPTRRPPRPAIMRQKWRDLLFLHWPIPPEAVRPLVPPQLDLDLHEGRAYVGLIPFTMRGVRPVWTPAVPGLSSFHETNVRTYVHRSGRDPGVWFFSLDAANRLAVRLARSWFYLPYYHARLFLEPEPTERNGDPHAFVYAGVRQMPGPRPASYAIRATPAGSVEPARPGTLEHFLVERYILYSTRGDHLYRGQVHHSAYPLQSATVHSLDENLLAAAALARPDVPPLTHFAGGVDVDVYRLEPVE